MTVSMRVMSAGDGYKYLLRTIAAADGDRSLSTPLTRYYSEQGTPPGRWMGSGLPRLGAGQLMPGDEVSEPQLQLLIGMGRDPITSNPLGRPFSKFTPTAERVQKRINALPKDIGVQERAVAIEQIKHEEQVRGSRRAVAGFDFTFSIPKSASVLWAVADGGTQALIWEAHQQAVAEVLGYMEREVAYTRIGAATKDGAVAQVETLGLVATGFDHFDSRAGDPHLHTHVVVSNKVPVATPGGGVRWLALDGRPLHAAVVALSELHEAVFTDHMTRMFGVTWEARDQDKDRNPAWAIQGVPEELVAEFSSRSRAINAATDELIDDYVDRHGRRPSPATIMKLRAQATLDTRPKKTVHSLADLTTEWRARAGGILGEAATAWASRVVSNDAPLLLRADDIPLDVLRTIGTQVVEEVGEKRTTWRRGNLLAESARQTMPWRFATMQDREAVIAMIADAAEHVSLRLTPPELASTPARFMRSDGTSAFRPKNSITFSSETLLAAEDRLLALTRHTDGPVLPLNVIEHVTSTPDEQGRLLGGDQAAALTKIALSGRTLDVLIGPAGAGKTTAMSALRTAWEAIHGPGSVVGLAPSAVAAQVLAEDLGIETENTAKWWENHLTHGTTFAAGQLVILDEASLAGTLSLDRITQLAAAAGAKTLLVGDYAQLQSVDAGGAFALLAGEIDDAPELTEIHRFSADWEKLASLDLRHGHTSVLDTYEEQGRILGDDAEVMEEAAYQGWAEDRAAGYSSILIAEARDTVTRLNIRARADLALAGVVDASGIEVALHDGNHASAGDLILTRKNDRRIRSAYSWVRNGDLWEVVNVRSDGSLTIRPPGAMRGALVLPASYVMEHVELGYAVTSHRAEGVTVDTAHALVMPGATRESFYVDMTRGRHSNRAYVGLDRPDDHAGPYPGDTPEPTAKAVLAGVLAHSGAELSAHETIAIEQARWGSIMQLAAEYETIAAEAQKDRWAGLLHRSGLASDMAEAVLRSPAFDALVVELRQAEANRHDIEDLLPRLIAARTLEDADDPAAVLHYRVQRANTRPGTMPTTQRPRLIAGLVPEAADTTGDMRQALAERAELIEQRALTVLNEAAQGRAEWVTELGPVPDDPARRTAWVRAARTIAAYRDLYDIEDTTALGAEPTGTAQRVARARAAEALTTAQQQQHDMPEQRRPAPSTSARVRAL